MFHFRPPSQWMNDVCGAFFYQGWHHVFFQYHPKSDAWGQGIGWGHTRSRDLVHWEHLPPALLQVFVNDGPRTVTKVVYPGTNHLHLEAFVDTGASEATALNAWEMKPIW